MRQSGDTCRSCRYDFKIAYPRPWKETCDNLTNSRLTLLKREVWFPCTHTDVEVFAKIKKNSHNFFKIDDPVTERKTCNRAVYRLSKNAKTLAHCSIGDSPTNKFSDCEDRLTPDKPKFTKVLTNIKSFSSSCALELNPGISQNTQHIPDFCPATKVQL